MFLSLLLTMVASHRRTRPCWCKTASTSSSQEEGRSSHRMQDISRSSTCVTTSQQGSPRPTDVPKRNSPVSLMIHVHESPVLASFQARVRPTRTDTPENVEEAVRLKIIKSRATTLSTELPVLRLPSPAGTPPPRDASLSLPVHLTLRVPPREAPQLKRAVSLPADELER